MKELVIARLIAREFNHGNRIGLAVSCISLADWHKRVDALNKEKRWDYNFGTPGWAKKYKIDLYRIAVQKDYPLTSVDLIDMARGIRQWMCRKEDEVNK